MRRTSILTAILAINAAILLLALGLSAMAVNTYASSTFMQLMQQYQLATESVQGMFLASINQTMLMAGVGALVVGGVLSWWLTRRVVTPLRKMETQAQAIASGSYEQHIEPVGNREVVRLAEALNAMASSLAETERLRRDLVTNLGHELRTPLANIAGYLEGLQDGVFAPDGERLQLLHDEVARLTALVDAMRELARVEWAAQRGGRASEHDLVRVVEDQLALFMPRLRAKELDVDVDWRPVELVLPLDLPLTQRVIANLLENVQRYTPEGGHVRIRGTREAHAGQVMLRVGNTLVRPLAERDRRYLFERFYRVEASRSREDGGAGVGLAIVREAVAAQHGSVRVEADDHWIEFVLVFPSRPNAGRARRGESAAPA